MKKIILILCLSLLVGCDESTERIKYSCSSGFTFDDKSKTCYKDEIKNASEKYECNNIYSNQRLEGKKCIYITETNPDVSYECPSGYRIVSFNMCFKNDASETISATEKYKCSVGYLNGKRCEIEKSYNAELKYACEEGYEVDGKSCIKRTFEEPKKEIINE